MWVNKTEFGSQLDISFENHTAFLKIPTMHWALMMFQAYVWMFLFSHLIRTLIQKSIIIDDIVFNFLMSITAPVD